MSAKTDLLREARRCAYEASRGVSPGHKQMFSGLSKFYSSLATSEETTETPERREPPHRKDKTAKG